MSDSTPIPDDAVHDEEVTPKSRSPIERVIVWVLIAGLLVVVGAEYLGQSGYNSTVDAFGAKIRNNPEVMMKLSEARTLVSGSPSETTSDGARNGDKVSNRILTLSWFSLFKRYEVELTIEADEDDPTVLNFTTADPEEPEVLAAGGDSTSDEDDAALAAAGPGGGMGPGGGHDAEGDGSGNRGGGGGRRRRSRGILGELQEEWVQAELGMTAEQTAKLPEIAESVRPDFSAFQGMSPEERTAAFQEIQTKSEAAVKELLDDEQFARVRELMFQRAGAQALAREDVATELGLDDSQKKQVAELIDQRRGALRELGFGSSAEDREEAAAPWDALLMEVLTEDQAGKWQAMLGAPPEKGPEPEVERPRRPSSDTPSSEDSEAGTE